MPERQVSTGTEFLDLARSLETSCEARTDATLPRLGKRAPKTYEQLGVALSLLDRVASCYWACARGDHAIERLAARASSNSRAALRLMRAGFYDEALGLARSVGEACNLLQLFVFDPSALDDWRVMNGPTRRRTYSAVRVRLRLEEVAGRAIIQNDRYGALSGYAAHPDPDTPPQVHNALGVPSSGGRFQEAGLLMSLNELGLGVGGVLLLAAMLAGVPSQQIAECREAAMKLIGSLGGVEVLRRETMWATLARAEET
ncbi:MAG: hypothetical protein LC808_32945 [Actinobacteria bacterium]|nr:hypothetical protein [Actinomycetota bacterium]